MRSVPADLRSGAFDASILRRLDADRRARRTQAPLEPIVEAALRTRRHVVFELAHWLAEWERYDLLEHLITNAQVPGGEAQRDLFLAQLSR